MKSAYLAISFALLSACNATTDQVSAPTATIVKQYSDGTGVVTGTLKIGTATDDPAVIASSNTTVAQEVLNQSINLTAIPGSASSTSQLYRISYAGTASDGSSVRADTNGMYLTAAQQEYVSISGVTVNNSSVGLLTAGSKPSNIPSGTFNYNGGTVIVDRTTGSIGEGTFTMQANFNTNRASISATATDDNFNPFKFYYFSSNDVRINQADGSFSSSSALIGEQGGSSEAASVTGYFAGNGATGVHGMVYPNTTQGANWLGAFVGVR